MLVAATAGIAPDYFRLPVVGLQNPIYRERVYTYELYHQLRGLLEKDEQLSPYRLSGEIDKQGHPVVGRRCPDFVFHIPGKMENLVVIEVKPVNVVLGEIEEDYQELARFVGEIGYHCGVQLVYGDDETACVRIERLFREGNHPQLQLFWHRRACEPANRIFPE